MAKILEDIIKFEETGFDSIEDEAKAFQKMINSGMAWKLQGAYGREAMDMIESGYCTLGDKGHRNYYGNYVPSRYEVEAGTKGSLEYCKKMQPDFWKS